MNRTLVLVLLAAVSGRASAQSDSIPPGYSTTVQGDSHDFDFFVGAWTTRQKRLKATGVGSTDWMEPPANQHCAMALLDSGAIVDQGRYPNGSPAGRCSGSVRRVDGGMPAS